MIQASFSVITDQWHLILGILLLITLSHLLISSILKNIFSSQLTADEYFALGMAGWILPAFLIALLSSVLGFEPSTPFNLFILIFLFISSIFFLLRFKTTLETDSKPTTFILLCCFSISILLRLVLVSKAILPSYFDSAQHYLIIKNILENKATGVLSSLTISYYHLGYHFLAAFITSISQAEIAKTMLIFGQIILATLPLSLFFLIKHETRSNLAGIFTVSLAAFGWYMPAHAVDWGKYPALTSVGMLPFVLSLAYLVSRYKNILSPQKRSLLYILLGIAMLVSGLLHSRSLIIIAIAGTAGVISAWQQKLSPRQQVLIVFIVIVAIIAEALYIQKQDILTLLFDPYIQKGILVTALVLFLSIFAQRSYPQLTFTCILAIGFILGSLFIPVIGLIPGYEHATLLDRPFAEMILFLPLSMLGGLGLAGLEKSVQQIKLKILIGLGATCLVLINAIFTYDLYLSDCCVLAGNDDMLAMDWMNMHLPMDAHVGVSATELKVLASDKFEGYVGGDAGIWVTPLIARSTTPIFYDTNFSEQSTLETLCQMGISHLYVGELGQNFDSSQLNAQPTWYKLLLSMPQVKVYEVVGCNLK